VEVKLNTFLTFALEGSVGFTLRPFVTPEIVPVGQEVVWVSETVRMLWKREKFLAFG
jgi:hypothetical protein